MLAAQRAPKNPSKQTGWLQTKLRVLNSKHLSQRKQGESLDPKRPRTASHARTTLTLTHPFTHDPDQHLSVSRRRCVLCGHHIPRCFPHLCSKNSSLHSPDVRLSGCLRFTLKLPTFYTATRTNAKFTTKKIHCGNVHRRIRRSRQAATIVTLHNTAPTTPITFPSLYRSSTLYLCRRVHVRADHVDRSRVSMSVIRSTPRPLRRSSGRR